MKTYVTKSGATMTDADFERLAVEAERGEYPGVPGEWLVRPQGRPRISSEDLVLVSCKIPRSQRDAMDRKAHEQGSTRSEWMREAFSAALA